MPFWLDVPLGSGCHTDAVVVCSVVEVCIYGAVPNTVQVRWLSILAEGPPLAVLLWLDAVQDALRAGTGGAYSAPTGTTRSPGSGGNGRRPMAGSSGGARRVRCKHTAARNHVFDLACHLTVLLMATVVQVLVSTFLRSI